MTRIQFFRRAVVTAFLFLLLVQVTRPVRSEAVLTIGSMAPSLNISDWLQQGGGKYPKVTTFEPGKVYVVEFWATWCPPCIQTMPHIAKLQEEYADKDVQIISVSDESVEEIQEFLKREAGSRDGEPVTFEKLTSVYSLTTDPDGSTQNDYTVAAKQRGIPCAFIVGKDSKIEWIGHPAEMEEPLSQVVEGKWNREAFAQQYNDERSLESLKESLARVLQDPGEESPSKKSIDSAFEMVDDFIAKLKTPSVAKQTRFLKFDLLIQFRSESPEVVEVGREVFKEFSARPIELHSLTWGIYEFANAGHIKNPKLVEAALKATQDVLPRVPAEQRGTVLDTIAHLQYSLGDLKAALASAQEAAKAPDATADVQAFIEQLETELKTDGKENK